MKKLILIITILVAAFTANAQTENTSFEKQMFEYQIQQLADTIIILDSIQVRPILVADSNAVYYITYKEVGFQMQKAYLQVWNKNGDRIKIWLRKNERPDIELPPMKVKSDINVNQ